MDNKNSSPKIGVICGGGGFTSETMLILFKLSLKRFRFIITGGLHFDKDSYNRIIKFFPDNIRVVTVENPRLITVANKEKIFSSVLNLFESFMVVLFKKFDMFLCVGSNLCIPFFFFSKFNGIKCIYLDSYNRVHDLSMTGKIVYRLRLADKFYVLHSELHAKYPRTIFIE